LTLLGLPRELEITWWTTMGLFVGSFLNVAIHRLPKEGMSVSHPRRSVCPSCNRQLTWKENVPLLSWLVQRGRCRGCGWRIPFRYPLVEALTAALWWLCVVSTPEGEWPLLLVRLLVISGLIVATFVDFDCFEIPDEVSIGGMFVAPIASLLVPSLHSATWVAQRYSEGPEVTRTGALIGSLAGLVVGGGILLVVGWIGEKLLGREAMGFGDVKLLAAAGGFVGPGAALAALVIASFVGAFVGIANIGRFVCFLRRRVRERKSARTFAHSLAAARAAGQMLPFGPYLALGTALALLYWEHLGRWF
jgi:leader peptidase (prepilin peptidase) / N-methyltransferase